MAETVKPEETLEMRQANLAAVMRQKTDTELDTIIDSYKLRPGVLLRQVALDERHRREREQDKRSNGIQKSIRNMTMAILFLTILAVVLAIIALVK